MKKLITLLTLVLGVLTSTTYALEFNLDQYGSNKYIPEWQLNRFDQYFYSKNKGLLIEKSNSQISNSFGYTGFSFYWINYKPSTAIYNYGFSYKYDNEGITLYQAKYKGAVQYYNTFSMPSRTAYQYTNSIGNKFLFSEIFVYDNQFTLYDPESRYGVSRIGDVRLENMMLVSNPRKEEQNVFLIQLQKQKAYSLTVDKNKARELWKGNGVNKAFLKSLNFEKSYTLTSGGNNLLPPGFKEQYQGMGFIYTEDIEIQSMDWGGGKNNNPNTPNQGGKNDVNPREFGDRTKNYNQCVGYWQNIKTYSKFYGLCAAYANPSGPRAAEELTRRRNIFFKILSWDGVSELDVSSNDYDCYRFKGVKESYKKKYSENWESFLKDATSDDYSDLDIKLKCGDKPVIGDNDKNVSKEQLEEYKQELECRNSETMAMWLYRACKYMKNQEGKFLYPDDPSQREKMRPLYCQRREAEKADLIKNYGSSKIELCKSDDMIKRIEADKGDSVITQKERNHLLPKWIRGEGGTQLIGPKFWEPYNKFMSGLLNDQIYPILGVGGSGLNFLGYFTDPFMSGANDGLFIKSSCGYVNENFNIFVYVLFFLFLLYLVKIF